jgi:hypothetical protein
MNRLSLTLAAVLITAALTPLQASADDEVQDYLPWVFDNADPTLTPSLPHKNRHRKTGHGYRKPKQRIWDQDDPLGDSWSGRMIHEESSSPLCSRQYARIKFSLTV